MISSPSEAIQLLGGWKAVSDRINRPLTTVASWATRDSIPVKEWPAVIKLAEAEGRDDITYETLTHAHAKAAKPRKRRAA